MARFLRRHGATALMVLDANLAVSTMGRTPTSRAAQCNPALAETVFPPRRTADTVPVSAAATSDTPGKTPSQQVIAGNLRGLAVLSAARTSVLPDVPTTSEAGLPGLEAGTWYAVMGPSAIPTSIIAKLNKQINTTLSEPVFRKRVIDMGISIMGGTPEDVTSFIASEGRKWSEVVQRASIKVD